ncbi:hypothetical protein ACTUVN_004194, partial [Pseudomonas caspiana]
MPAMQATRFVRHTALSFIASKLAPTGIICPVGARLARELGDAVYQADHQSLWERCLPAMQATRFVRHTALSFIAGKR